jgi:hypothetical protein
MNKTAMQELIEFIGEQDADHPELFLVRQEAKKLLEKEKEQIIAAYYQGDVDGGREHSQRERDFITHEHYFNSTYQTKHQ